MIDDPILWVAPSVSGHADDIISGASPALIGGASVGADVGLGGEQALICEGTGAYAAYTGLNLPIGANSTDWAISVWLKNAAGTSRGNLHLRNSGGDSLSLLEGSSASWRVGPVGQLSGAETDALAGSIQDNTWQHVVVTHRGGRLKVYLDGNEVADGEPLYWDTLNTFDTLELGWGGDLANDGSCRVDDCRIFDHVLDASDVWQLYSGGSV